MIKNLERVDPPVHYGGADNQYEVIKVLEAWLTPEEFRGFLKGNVIKYNARARLKNGDEDYAKALWYLKYMDDYNRRMRERAERRVPKYDAYGMTPDTRTDRK